MALQARVTSRTRHVLALTGVAALHAGALLILFVETRTRLMPLAAETPPLIVMLLSPFEPPRAAGPEWDRRRPARHPRVQQQPVRTEEPTPGVSLAPRASIDWLAEGADAAARQVEGSAQHKRQARALEPDTSMFAPAPAKRPGIAWDYAATHRVEPIGGLTTVLHVNDNCVVVMFVVIPFVGGCALGKIPARGDLFDHMHDNGDDERRR